MVIYRCEIISNRILPELSDVELSDNMVLKSQKHLYSVKTNYKPNIEK